MPNVVLKVPLGPAVQLRDGEVGAFFRHRNMLFCYIGAAVLGLVGSAGGNGGLPEEIIFSLAALQVAASVAVIMIAAKAMVVLARLARREAVLRLGWLLLLGTLTAVLSAEFCDSVLMGQHPTPPLHLLAQVVFYGTLVVLTISAVLQFTLDRMLFDMRGAGRMVDPSVPQGGGR